MRNPGFRWALAACLVAVAAAAAKADPPRTENPSPPRVVYSVPVVGPLYSYPRLNRWDVWQNYGVDNWGNFRPVVIDSPHGLIYRYNREPFPWFPTHNWEQAPYLMGPAYRAR
jgi:hypothetical protein